METTIGDIKATGVGKRVEADLLMANTRVASSGTMTSVGIMTTETGINVINQSNPNNPTTTFD